MVDVPVTADTRRALRDVVLEDLAADVKAATEQVSGGPWDGVPVVTEKAWGEALEAAQARPVPPTSENTAELETPATIYFQAVCPRCGGRSAIKLVVTTELKIDWHSATLAVKGKTKAVTHICGQTTVDEAIEASDGEQDDFNLADIVGDPVQGPAGLGPEADDQGTTEPEEVTPEEAESAAVDEAAALLLDDAVPTAEPERCPYPGCVRDADHRGKHKVVKPPEGDEDGPEPESVAGGD